MGGYRVLWWLLMILVTSAANPLTWNDFELDGALTAMELDRYEYEDRCNNEASAEWAWILAGSPATGPAAERKFKAEEDFAAQKRDSSRSVHRDWDADNQLPPELAEEMDMEAHPGDELLNHKVYLQKLNYSNNVAILYDSTKIPCFRNPASCQMGIHDVRRILAQSGDVAELLHTWRHWHTAVKTGVEGYIQQLKLLQEAASANEIANPTSYWVHLQELDATQSEELSYDRAEEFWAEIKPLYTKLQQYVARWLRHQLGDIGTDSMNIPAHVLGSLTGEDWSHLADLVSPPDDSTLKNIQKGLASQGLVGRRLYSETVKVMKEMGLEKVPEHLWKDVNDTGTCPPKTVRYCDDEGTIRVLTCAEPSWNEYLDAHEITARAVMSHMAVDYNKHILRQKNRYSALQDAIPGMVSLLAVSPARLNTLNLLPKETDSETDTDYEEYDTYSETRPNQALLLFLALRTLPRLPYYLQADQWRLNMLANNATNTSSWSKFRKQYQMIEAPDGDESDISFLSDPYLLSNRPYLVKFFATILQFQFLEYFVDIAHENPLEAVKEKNELGTMMTRSQSLKWMDVIQEVFNMNSISTEALLNYFKPLEKLLDKAVKKEDPKVTRRVVEFTTPKPVIVLNTSPDIVEEVPRDQPPSTTRPLVPTESVSTKNEETDQNSTLASTHMNSTDVGDEMKKGSTGVSTAILIASLVVFALAVTAGVLVAARRCYKRKYQRNRRPTTER